MTKKMLFGDVLLIFVILSLCVVIPLFVHHNESEDKIVIISVGSDIIYTAPISEDVEFSPDAGHTYVTVKDGKAYVSCSDCSDGLCMKMKPVEKLNQSVICLPNRVSIRFEGSSKRGADINAG